MRNKSLPSFRDTGQVGPRGTCGRVRRRRGVALAVGFIVLAGLLPNGVSPRAASEREAAVLKIGVFPRYGLRGTLERFTPLGRYLAARLERPVEVHSAPNFTLFRQALEGEDYDLVHFNQYHYVRAHKTQGYQVIAMNEEEGHARMAGALIVRGDSDIAAVAQLKGRRIVFGGGPYAMQSYIVATWLLRRAGLGAGDYTQEFARSPVNAILAAYHGQAAAAGSADANLNTDLVRRHADTRDLRVLAKGPALAHLPWAVKAGFPAALRQRVRSLLFDLNKTEEGREVLRVAGLTALRPASDADYDPHRRIIEQVLGESY